MSSPIRIKYRPLPKQKQFHESQREKVAFIGGYACLDESTLIITKRGAIPICEVKFGDQVLSNDNGKLVWSKTFGAYPKARLNRFRFSYRDRQFVGSEQHQTFCFDNKYRPLASFYDQARSSSSLQNQLLTISESFLSGLLLNDQSFLKKVSDYKYDYLACCHQYDQQLLHELKIFPSVFPSHNDATKLDHNDTISLTNLLFLQLDSSSQDKELKHSHQGLLCNLSIHHSFRREDHFEEVLEGFPFSSHFERISEGNLTSEKSLCLKYFHHKDGEFVFSTLNKLDACYESSYSNTYAVSAKASIEKTNSDWVWDLHVLGTNNYISIDGAIHHNSGKTHSLIMHMFKLMNLNKATMGGLLCPTLKMAKRDVIPGLRSIATDNKIIYDFNKADSYLYFPQTKNTVWIFHGEDDGESIRGPNLSFMLINEFTLINEPTYQAAIARVREPKAKFRQVAMSGTFENHGGVYDIITQDPQCEIIYGSTRENHHVPSSYIKMLESSYDEDMQKQYIDGIPIVNMSKKALRRFDRNKHVRDVKYNPELPIWISMDFNVDPMSCVLWNRYPDVEGGPVLRAFKEYCIRDSSTQELANQIRAEFDPSLCVVFPDPAGNSRSTKAHGTTDIDILRQAGFKDIRFKRAIPSVRDCLNAANNMLAKEMIVIDPSCKEFIKDCERVELKPGTDIIDKSDNRRSHMLDGFKNMVDYEFPIKAIRGSWKEVKVR